MQTHRAPRAALLAVLLVTALAACTPGRAGAPVAPDTTEVDWARAELLGSGIDALLAREAPPVESDPFDAEEPTELEVEPTDFARLVPEEDFGEPAGGDVAAFGVGAWPPPSAEELAAMSEAGVAHARVFLPYVASEDYSAPSPAYVAAIDGLFADAARAEIELLPVLIAAGSVPALTDDALTRWGDFAFWAASRYGAAGDFWEEREELPDFPPRVWEVWSEPNHPSFFDGAVDADHYRALLLYARVGLRDGDAAARVLVGGLAPSGMPGVVPPSMFLTELLASPDAEQLFEGVGAHPYAANADGTMRELATIRAVLDGHGLLDAPIWVTAIGWAARDDGPLEPDDEAARADRLGALLDVVDARREELAIGPIYWDAYRDRTLDETGGVDEWPARTGLFAVESGTLRTRPAADVALERRERVALPVLRDAPGRFGPVRTHDATRRSRRDDGARRGRSRPRRRLFRRTVIGRMYQIGTCVNADGELKRDCDPWTLPAADTWQVERYPDLDERRAMYVCDALLRVQPRFVSGLVRYGSDDVLSEDPAVQAEIERQARVFRMVRGCVRRESRHPVRFDVVLNALHFTHEVFGIHTGNEGGDRHREVLRRLDALFHPSAWFYDFYTDPFEDGARTEETCYQQGTACGTFHPDGMTQGMQWAHARGQWIGGNTFRGEGIPRGTDYVSITSAGGMQRLASDRDRARRGNPDLPILMHIRNDPQAGCSEGLAFIHRGDRFRRRVMRRHIRNQRSIGYAYMYPVFFPLRFVRRDPTPDPEPCREGGRNYGELGRSLGFATYDGRAEGQLAWMRWNMRHRQARP